MTDSAMHAAAFQAPTEGKTDPELRVAAGGHGESDANEDPVRIAERHGIWTVTVVGIFVGDHHDPDATSAAAAQARHR